MALARFNQWPKWAKYGAVTAAAVVLVWVGTVYYRVVNRSVQSEIDAEGRAWKDRDARLQALQAKQKALADQLKQYAGDGSCKSSGDCKAVGLGAKTCDGYLNFFHYSTRTVDDVNFFATLKEFNRNQEIIFKESFSTAKCGVASVPSFCVQGRCVPEKYRK